jgi:hypothetical protein
MNQINDLAHQKKGASKKDGKSRQSFVNGTIYGLARGEKGHDYLETLQPYLNLQCRRYRKGHDSYTLILLESLLGKQHDHQ